MPPFTMKFSEITSNQSTRVGPESTRSKCSRRRPTPCPRTGLRIDERGSVRAPREARAEIIRLERQIDRTRPLIGLPARQPGAAESRVGAGYSPPPSPESPAAEPPGAPTAVTDPDSKVLLVLPEQPREKDIEARSEAVAESHVQSFPLPQGGAIELGGIAWSETGPFALLNGRVVGPGAVIQGYTLEHIRPGHVELTGDGRRIQLSLQ